MNNLFISDLIIIRISFNEHEKYVNLNFNCRNKLSTI